MKVYEVWIDNSGTLRSQGFKHKTFSTKAKAEECVKHLKNTTYKNYYAEFWIAESLVH